ncbi:MAG: hypothetical protein QT02_C0007G0028 [archaeon GW2011_AR9]|nr:MAG: hypothetical protein QT02_C0007G0028 [archaeon GW2011_AR9]MBS3120793.1 hypothetical protein [Candidatus Woesearchaeota archaeon]
MMKNKFNLFFVLIILLVPLVSADAGPHPSATLEFIVTYNNQSISNDSVASLIVSCPTAIEECEGKVDTTGPCEDGICSFYYYRIERIPSNFRVEVYIPSVDKSFMSDAITFSYLEDSPLYYKIAFTDDDVTNHPVGPVTPITPLGDNSANQASYLLWSFLIALTLTILIELCTTLLLFKRWKIKKGKWKTPLLTIFCINLLSVPLVWVIFSTVYSLPYAQTYPLSGLLLALVISETFAFVLEAFVIYFFNKKLFSLQKSFWLSGMINLMSFILGGIILTVLVALFYAYFAMYFT